MEFLSLKILYLVCLIAGVVFSFFQLILGGMGDLFHGLASMINVDIGDAGVDVGGHELAGAHNIHIHPGDMGGDVGGGGPPFFNTLTVATFVTSFGAYGLVGLELVRLSPPFSLLFSIPLSFGTSAGVFWIVYKFLFSQQASTIFKREEIKGRPAEVIVSIPPDGMGEIAYIAGDTRSVAPAKSIENEFIKQGEIVKIEYLLGAIAYVRKMSSEDLKEKKGG